MAFIVYRDESKNFRVVYLSNVTNEDEARKYVLNTSDDAWKFAAFVPFPKPPAGDSIGNVIYDLLDVYTEKDEFIAEGQDGFPGRISAIVKTAFLKGRDAGIIMK